MENILGHYLTRSHKKAEEEVGQNDHGPMKTSCSSSLSPNVGNISRYYLTRSNKKAEELVISSFNWKDTEKENMSSDIVSDSSEAEVGKNDYGPMNTRCCSSSSSSLSPNISRNYLTRSHKKAEELVMSSFNADKDNFSSGIVTASSEEEMGKNDYGPTNTSCSSSLSPNVENISRNYLTRMKKKLEEQKTTSKIDWKRTKKDSISQVISLSDESTSNTEDEMDENDEEDLSSSSSMSERNNPKQEEKNTSAEDFEEEHITKPKRRRSSAVLNDSDTSSDSEGPIRKVFSKRHCILDYEDESSNEKITSSLNNDTQATKVTESTEDVVEGNSKKQKLEKLKQLAKKTQKSKNLLTSSEDSDVEMNDLPLSLSDDNDDSDSLSNFIVNDEEDAQDGDTSRFRLAAHQELFLKHHIPLLSSNDLGSHFERVIKAFLINIIDSTFLVSLYDGTRQKKYAKEMLNSLNYLDERIILPRLAKLTTSCRWSTRYKERVDCYPLLHIKSIYARDQPCQACQLQRHCRFQVMLSGQSYNGRSMESDDFMSNDKQLFQIGKVCSARTEVYHQLKHYKYYLYKKCSPYIHDVSDKSAKEIVETSFNLMANKGIIKKEFNTLENYLNEADYFQEEQL
ncbi:coiled-coil domain-containing protein 82 [Bombina bombina]|uniref:coiled-coil domain-containing protein 82 n=1 Tax=Bombina bombina TaxID=8345 RepID=UPI00235B1D4D|nr:coiled-coil domain-containing protein 82 [Bombina bombina]